MNTEEWWNELAAVKERVAYIEGRLHEQRRTGTRTAREALDHLRNIRHQVDYWTDVGLLSAEAADAIYEHEKQRLALL